MTHTYYLKVERCHGKQIVRVAAGHNTRDAYTTKSAADNIDPARTPFNLILRGPDTAKAIGQLAATLMKAAGVGQLRKDAVTMIEVVFSLPDTSTIDPRAYFEDCTRWAEQHFDVPVLSSVVHLDEGAPHCHLLLLPLHDGRMVGSSLYGTRAMLAARQSEFYQTVAQQHGLAEQAAAPRLSAGVRKQMMALVAAHLSLTADQATYLLRPHKNLATVLAKLGLTLPANAKPASTFVEIMTKPQKPIRFHQPKTVNGFDLPASPALDQNRTCDGFGPAPTTQISTSTSPRPRNNNTTPTSKSRLPRHGYRLTF